MYNLLLAQGVCYMVPIFFGAVKIGATYTEYTFFGGLEMVLQS